MNAVRTLFVASLALAFLGCSSSEETSPPDEAEAAKEPRKPATKPPTAPPKAAAARRPAPPPRQLFGTLTINDARATGLASGTPVYARCALTNPHEKAAIEAPALATINPTVAKPDGTPVDAAWAPLGQPPGRIEPRSVAQLAWSLETPLPPGDYRIGLAVDASTLKSDPPVGRVHVTPARVEIAAGKADAGWKAHFERRILALKGERAALIATLEKQIAAEPDSPLLRRDLADALEAAGRYDDAAAQLRRLATLILKKGKGTRTDHPLPDWLVFRLEALARKTPKK